MFNITEVGREWGQGKAVINADETLAAGTYEQKSEASYPQGKSGAVGGPPIQPRNKGEMMERRLAARIPLVLFAIDLKTGKETKLLYSTDWINHLLFSPTDPTLLMYCHEGPWKKVDRIWTIRTDGSRACSSPSAWSTCRTTTTGSSRTSASRRTTR